MQTLYWTFFIERACGELDKDVTIFVWYVCVRACVRVSIRASVRLDLAGPGRYFIIGCQTLIWLETIVNTQFDGVSRVRIILIPHKVWSNFWGQMIDLL